MEFEHQHFFANIFSLSLASLSSFSLLLYSYLAMLALFHTHSSIPFRSYTLPARHSSNFNVIKAPTSCHNLASQHASTATLVHMTTRLVVIRNYYSAKSTAMQFEINNQSANKVDGFFLQLVGNMRDQRRWKAPPK